MWDWDHLGTRQRLAWTYAGCTVIAAAAIIWAFPEQTTGVVAMGGAGLVAAWLMVRMATRRLRRRLHELREATDALGSGRMMEQIRHLPSDDFVKLTESVERLAAQLREMLAEQDRLRQRLSRSEKLAAMGELAAIVAHEVNNPLDGLQNSISILRRHNGQNEQSEQLLNMMEAGLSRIEATVRRLLSMSRDEPITLMSVPLETMVDDAVMFVEPRLNRYGIRLIRDFPERLVHVLADSAHMAQVLINLMINAADAMRSKGGSLTLRCRVSDCAHQAWLDVIDTGTGIEDQHLPRIFEPFFSTKGKGAGTGLGLAVVAQVVQAHKGRITVQTQLGKGTCFRLELPMVADAQQM